MPRSSLPTLACLLGCTHVPAPPVVANNHSAPVVPTTADALVRQTLAALAAGSVDELVRLGSITAPSLACAGADVRELRESDRTQIAELVRVVAKDHAQLTVLAIHDDRPQQLLVRAQRGPACDDIPVVEHQLVVELHETVSGRPLHLTHRATIEAIVVDGQWYLAAHPSVPVESAVYREDSLSKLNELTDQMCACKDAACTHAVTRALDAWQARRDPEFPDLPDGKTEEDDAQEITRQTGRAAGCKNAVTGP